MYIHNEDPEQPSLLFVKRGDTFYEVAATYGDGDTAYEETVTKGNGLAVMATLHIAVNRFDNGIKKLPEGAIVLNAWKDR